MKKLRKLFFWTFVLGLAGLLFLLSTIPDVSLLKDHYPAPRDIDSDQPLRLSVTRPDSWVPLRSISPYLRRAILISEDDAFYQHDGIDWNQLQKALEDRFEGTGRLRGASTITQQLAKNVYLNSEKSLLRKLREALIAKRIEQELGKDRIFEIYLNVIEFGTGIYGVANASHFYFLKHPADLSPKESAFLAMLLPNPKKYSASFRKGQLSNFAASSIRRILERMHQMHWLTDELYAEQLKVPLNFEKDAVDAWNKSKAQEAEARDFDTKVEDLQKEQFE